MKRIIFVCHGNICRSPMAEYIMKHIVKTAGRSDEFQITSAAVSYDEIGNDIYPPAAKTLRKYGVPFGHHSAHRITQDEFREADIVITMDNSNMRLLRNIVGDEEINQKAKKLLDLTPKGGDVADPWYTGDFEQTYRDIVLGCTELLNLLS